MKISSFLFLALLPLYIFSQATEISNQYPQRGETIQLYYTPDSASKFSLDDEVFARIAPNNEDYSSESETIKMRREENRFVLPYQIGSLLSAGKVYFQNADGYDRSSTLTFQVKNSKGEFYRNGYIPVLFDSPEKYKEELAAFSDNYTVYRYRWQLLPYAKKDSASIIIDQELKRLKKKGKKHESLYYALSCGFAQRGHFDEARESFLTLLKKYPHSHLITDAHSYYRYQLFSNSGRDSLFPQIVLNFIKENPTTALAKEQLSALYKKEEITDREALSKIVTYWMEKEPDNAMLYYHHANTLESQPDRLFYYNKALNTFLDGDLAVKKDYTWRSDLPYSMYQLAKAFRKNGAFGQAFSISQIIEDNYDKRESYFVMQQGRILQNLHRYKEAIEVYLDAGNMGEAAGRDSAKSIFENQSFYGSFEDYASQYEKEQFSEEEVFQAPSFSAMDLEGNTYKLEELRGKVVVLNFWFIGCAPCRIEMPGLNEMVAEYKGKDVVFLAFAMDQKESLEEFLETTAFDYQIFPEAGEVANIYEVEGFPTHVVIDKEGKIRSTLVGGSADRHNNIKPLIDRALAF